MRILVLALLPVLCLAQESEEPQDKFCYNNVRQNCRIRSQALGLKYCNAKYSGMNKVTTHLNQYVQQHILQSFQYLLMSVNFANYEKNREGFEKLYRKLSDSTWEDAIDLIKYITKRGETVDLAIPRLEEQNKAFRDVYEMYELESLGRALDMHKHLAEKAHKIHSESTKRDDNFHDAETISFIEKEYVHQHADTIRELSGYANDLKKLLTKQDNNLAVFLFDQHLKSVVG